VKRLEEEDSVVGTDVIIYRIDPALAELVEDDGGNQLPAQIDPSLREFLDRALPALRSGDRKVLRRSYTLQTMSYTSSKSIFMLMWRRRSISNFV